MYKSRRRPWVKLHCRDWITGTVRFQLGPVDRSIFIDLLTLAGDSRFPGTVAAGFEGAQGTHLMGYPMNWLAAHFGADEAHVRRSLALLEAQERIKVEEYKSTFIVNLLGWARYQSEYLRQLERFSGDAQTSTESQRQVKQTSGASTQKLSLEVEGEVEGERLQKAQTPALTPFTVFWQEYPVSRNKKAAERAWNRMSEGQRQTALEALVQFKQSLGWRKERGRYVPYAQKFLGQELYLESPAGGRAIKTGRSFDERFNTATKK